MRFKKEKEEEVKIDEGQPIMPEGFTEPKDENGNIIAEGAEGKTDADINDEGDGEETPVTPEGEEIAKSLEDNGEKAPETKDKGEELIEKAQALLNKEGGIEEALKNNEQESVLDTLNKELADVSNIKAELEADIKSREDEIRKRKFQKNFAGFWNGVSSGWED